jgi:orotate phosphoribosyltransferase
MIAERTLIEETLFRAGLLADEESETAVRRGHFRFGPGDHGDTWMPLGRLLNAPRLLRAAEALAQKLRAHRPELVCGQGVGGALIGPAVALALDLPFVNAEGAGPFVDGLRTAVVDDVIGSEASALGTTRALREMGAEVVVAGALIARASSVLPVGALGGLPVERLATIDWNVWPAASCPLCATGAPLSTSL